MKKIKAFKMLMILIFTIIAIEPKIRALDNACGNGICEPYETFYSCSRDCKSGGRDNYCDGQNDDVCDPDCHGNDQDCQEYDPKKNNESDERPSNKIGYILAIISAAAIVVFLIFVFKSLAHQQIEHEKRMYDIENINKFSNIKKNEDKGWSHKTESEIVDDLKNEEKFRNYFEK
ncbi:MAG: hypothetical protein KKF44_05360 [Nanoarchaeota archaeon]|nr:hypothetical protein [Nanoarchaeota archaeon]